MPDSIWHTDPSPERLQSFARGSMVEHLDIRITEVGDDYLRGTMPVDHRTHQPMGVLHGGASVVLAETLGSIGANGCVDSDRYYCVGIEVNANHIRSVASGRVTGTARPLHRGRTTQVWQIHIHDKEEHLVCTSRLTLAVRAHD